MIGQAAFHSGGPQDWPFEHFPDAALETSVVQRFQETAQRYANRLAISDVQQAFTYAQLAALVAAIAAAIEGARIPGGPVAIMLRNEARFPAAMLGVLASGRPFLPLDIDHPPERNSTIVAHAGAAAVLVTADVAAEVRAALPAGVPLIDIGELPSATAAPTARPGPDDLAVIIYTSGSTGRPKGVCQDHRTVLFGVQQWVNVGHLSCEDRQSVVTSPSNIAGVRHIVCPLLAGASLHVLPARALQPAGLARETRARRLTIHRSVPTVFRQMVETLGEGERFDSLRMVFFGGDRADWIDVDAFRRGCREDAILGVAVGASEVGANYTWWYVDESVRASTPRMPIGYSVGDPAISLIDDEGRPVGDGEVGEMVLTSRYLTHGYWREPELTARAFGADPDDPRRRVFRTGDLARRRPDGLFELIGRKDHQIKLHGHRIELAEVESAVTACTGVRDAAVLARRDADGDAQSLVAYAELQRGVEGLLPRHLMAMLSRRLPGHMMPSAIRIVAELPRLPNHKIDRSRLAEIDAQRKSEPSDPGDDPVLAGIIATFEAVLDCAATPEDNVLTLGGDSMQAISIALELEDRFDIPIPIDTFESTQTIRELAAWIAAQRGDATAAAAPA
jgi:amino acid adenylation domain-containing protein